MIEVTNLTKSYLGKKIIHNLSFEIKDGGIVALVGPSGAGKSTLLNMIGGIEPFDSGDIKIDNHSLSNLKQRINLLRYKVGFLFQNYALIDQETVDKNLEIALKFNTTGKNKQELKKEVLSEVGLVDKLSHKVYQLSGGQQQRVALARLMLKPCSIILADEPTGALDSDNRDLVLQHLQQFNEAGKTIIVATHDEIVADFAHYRIEI
ncbi:ATP-binding cassette domain-containing protein [Virgibacillus pantothenticus]|uniref:ATP-binding cassette domain-containing protein n=1 Tax=Virgibacillus pantothenticus TaxID=1473 RepID=UPI001C22176F|nr:ATP-binding cassette domain-containing protein [Virgibacillus pantothenticus]MBU8565187.1 ATP-binding cassette domain-containing protein [Virgibacillus pantothenticus]MBU8601471.1 ATP-binding cassette domain-containing protein [Virgibacillus pantothenticus]MBU8633506.1 ATP-binding cassette domain-containing protein [Virgibacillus pantothenticus]MBU8643400.1 ATP-binding cassette domain-containing protein [Virgibacillus pantothenticus]MBU8647545.1 ATP-binding cassette domain-containing protei